MPNLQHVENLLIRYRGQTIDVKTVSGGVYEGVIADVTNDYVALKTRGTGEEDDYIIVLLHSIESILPRGSR
jgi:ferredoxin-fold anticodon binding domain-containing protein